MGDSVRAGVSWVVLFGSLLAASAMIRAQLTDDELGLHLTEMRRRIEDPARPLDERAKLALETAVTLDRTAQAADTVELRRSRWAEAAALLEDFQARHPDHPRSGECALRAAIYRWAQARSWLRQAELDPTDSRARTQASALLDAAIRRLHPLAASTPPQPPGNPFAPTVRYRLAQALADRAELDPGGSEPRRAGGPADALAVLPPAGAMPAPLAGPAARLRAELLTRLGRFAEALRALDEAVGAQPAPPGRDLVAVRARALAGLGRFAEALKAIDGAGLDPDFRALLAIRVRLAQRASLPTGAARDNAEAEALHIAEALRDSDSPDARVARLELARAIPRPKGTRDLGAWKVLAEGRMALGDPAGAAELLLSAAEESVKQGHPQAAADLRYEAAASLYRAGRFDRVDPPLSQILDDPSAGPVRPKAGLLRALARGQALDTDAKGSGCASYLDALESQIRDFPGDPTADEARWRLGLARLASGAQDQALATWEAIPPHHPHWLDAHLAIANLRLAGLEIESPDAPVEEVQALKSYLDGLLRQAEHLPEKAEIELARLRVFLSPVAHDTKASVIILDRLMTHPMSADQRERAEGFRLELLLQRGQYAEAEAAARNLAGRPGNPATALELARLVDRCAEASESDLARRRHGSVLLVLCDRAPGRGGHTDRLMPGDRDEVLLLKVRGRHFTGDETVARRELDRLALVPEHLDTSRLRLLAGTCLLLGEVEGAIAAYRQLGQQSRPGGADWLDARYGMASAFARTGRTRAARQIVEAAALLHPELGGAGRRARFERLRRALETR